jgi:DnaK suppressor protein
MASKQSAADRKRYEVLNRLLRDRQAEIHNKLRALREVLPSDVADVKDAEEQSVADFVKGMDFALMEMESETLRKIDEAIKRLQEGTYGICAECEQKIAEARLRALPFARLCRDCQENEEGRSQPTARGRIPFDDGMAMPGRSPRAAFDSEPRGSVSVWSSVRIASGPRLRARA